MFKISMERSQVVILVYDDDLVIIGFKENGVICVKDNLRSLFELNDLAEISYILRAAFERQGSVMSLHQAAYRRRVLDPFGVESAT